MKADRKSIYEKYDGHCAYCGKEITVKDMQRDHFIPKYAGGTDDISNMMPSCRNCNYYKSAYHVETFRDLLKTIHERVRKIYIVRVCIDYGIIKIANFDGLFYFEKQKQNGNN